jgi:hypothetical protein
MIDEKFQTELNDIFLTQDSSGAISWIKKLKSQGDLDSSSQQIISQLQFIRIASLPIDEVIELLKSKISVAYSIPEYNLADKIEWYIDQKEIYLDRVDMCKKIKSVLEEHKAFIGTENIDIKGQQLPPTIANWLKDYYSWPAKGEQRDALSQLEFINKSANTKKLSPVEIEVLKNILKLSDFVNNLVADWDAVPTPKNESEISQGFDLYNFIPGLEVEEDYTPAPAVKTTEQPKPPMKQTAIPELKPQIRPMDLPRPSILTLPSEMTKSAAEAPEPAPAPKPAPLPQSKPGVVKDPTNIVVADEQERLEQERKLKSESIARKLADLKARNKQP